MIEKKVIFLNTGFLKIIEKRIKKINHTSVGPTISKIYFLEICNDFFVYALVKNKTRVKMTMMTKIVLFGHEKCLCQIQDKQQYP